MSKSIHITYNDIKHLSAQGIEEESKDPDSDFSQWSRKLAIKNKVPKQRKEKFKSKDS